MFIGIPKEVKNYEARVSLSPYGAKELVKLGHKVFVESKAGIAVGFSDEEYKNSGAIICNNNKEVFEAADLIFKVKEPQDSEIPLFKENQILFSYLHLAAEEKLTKELLKKKIIAISFETVEDSKGTLPLLTPMSEVAGRLSVQSGAYALQQNFGGKGLLLGGVPGVEPAKVVILGGGVVGLNAAIIAIGMGADVTILDKSLDRIRQLDNLFGTNAKILYAATHVIEAAVKQADLVIGAVLIPGAHAPKIVTKEIVASMKPQSVIVDVSIDQGGCIETSRPTSHSNPTYIEYGVIHYCVTNIPAAAAFTATKALENATLPYVIALANLGYKEALRRDLGFMQGLNIYHDKVTYKAVSDHLSLDYLDPKKHLGITS